MAWNPANYEKFKVERFPPFEGLASLVRVRPGLAFERQAIEQVSGRWDLVFSNAAIQWVKDHEWLMPRLMSSMVRIWPSPEG